jgi:hypothetical protein
MIKFSKSIPMRVYMLAALVFLIVESTLLFSRLNSENRNFRNRDTVKINILSKHIRLLREGRYRRIRFRFPDFAVMEDRGTGTAEEIENLDISCENGILRISTEKREFFDGFHLRVSSRRGDESFTVQFPGELRSYPLPVEFRERGDEFDVFVQESLSRYIADAAVAEYGKLHIRYGEAIKALSIVIAGRYYFNKRKPHEECDFCDLTHCQVYRGRISDEDFYGTFPDWLIDVKRLPVPLFFHSRCGGTTFDSRIFGYEQKVHGGIKDWISDSGLFLCKDKGALWENSISERELMGILFKGELSALRGFTITYDRERLRILLKGKNLYREYPPEDFRLRINRIKGWNFIKSNNYHITSMNIGGERMFKFIGSGLGHGVGLCQHGALRLAEMGYSRYEILEHYFPGISWIQRSNGPPSTPYLSYLIFSLKKGEIEKGGYGRLSSRMVSPGSIFKILVSLYVAHARRDLVKGYRYLCRGRSGDKNLPERCWHQDGHGLNDLPTALSVSCNLYFASLYKHIRLSDFKNFTENFFKLIDIRAQLPDIRSEKEFSRLLSGLDFRMKLSVGDLMKIIQFISPVNIDNGPVDMAKRLYSAETDIIHRALIDTVEKGTASGNLKPYGSELNYRPLLESDKKDVLSGEYHSGEIWGKTSTIIEGTNRMHSYGIFIGGDDERGVIVLLRKGNGHIAAKWGILLLHGARGG